MIAATLLSCGWLVPDLNQKSWASVDVMTGSSRTPRRQETAEANYRSLPPAGTLPIAGRMDIVTCRKTVRQLAAELGFLDTAQTMLVTAASELARNTLIHGGGGWFSWEVIREGPRRGIRLKFEDEGPGIPDIDLAMTNGWTSKKGMGLGLPGAKRLVNEFDVQSTVGRGTRVTITRWHVGV